MDSKTKESRTGLVFLAGEGGRGDQKQKQKSDEKEKGIQVTKSSDVAVSVALPPNQGEPLMTGKTVDSRQKIADRYACADGKDAKMAHKERQSIADRYASDETRDINAGLDTSPDNPNAPGMAILQRESGRQPVAMSNPGAYPIGHGATRETAAGPESLDNLAPPEEVAASNEVRAHPVNDLGNDLENARPVDTTRNQQKRNETKFRLALACLGVLAAFLFVVIAVIVQRDGSSGSDTGEDQTVTTNATTVVSTSAPTLSLEQHVLSLLPQYTVDRLTNPNTVQSNALQWLMADPILFTYTDKRILQRFALATTYFALGGASSIDGPGWMNYSVHECLWDYWMPSSIQYDRLLDYNQSEYKYINGLCYVPGQNHSVPFDENDNENEYYNDDVTGLALKGRELEGELPPQTKLLTSLKLLQLDDTTLTGTIPTILFDLTSLAEIHLSKTNSIVATIPTQVARLTNLKFLQLSGKGYYGTLPTEIGLLTDMVDLKISESSINGTIPTEWNGLARTLSQLQLSANKLSGTIPSQLGLLTNAHWWWVDQNQLTGTIPTELGQLGNAREFYLYSNHLSGTVPTQFGLLQNVSTIFAYYNMLSGSLPTEYGLLSSLKRFAVSFNEAITGTIPSQYGLCLDMDNLAISQTSISGTIPIEVASLERMAYLSFDGLQLSGTIPSQFGLAGSRMRRFRLRDNQLTGSIPTQVGTFNRTFEWGVSGQFLSGRLPSQLGLMKSLTKLYIQENQLSGAIPSEIQVLADKLQVFNATSNQFESVIPEGLCVLGEDNSGAFREFGFDCDHRLCGCDCTCGGDGNLNATTVSDGEKNVTVTTSSFLK